MAVKNRRPSRDDGCCSVSFLKYVLFIFNFIFYLSGLAILGAGVYTIFAKSNYAVLLGSKAYITTIYLLIAAGSFVLLVGIIGCVGVLKESRKCLLAFVFLLLVVFLTEAVAGVLAYVYSEQIQKSLQISLNHTLATGFGVDRSVTKAAEDLHKEFACCGSVNYQDWETSRWYAVTNEAQKINDRGRRIYVPNFCCKTVTEDCGFRTHPSNIYTEGCAESLKEEIRNHEIVLGAIALGISTVQLFGMVLSCCLFVKLKDFEDLQKARRSNNYYASGRD